MKGVCFLYSETGTEGGFWAMQEDGYETKEGDWSYEGLRCLKEGDEFTVFGDDGRVLWNGIIHQDTETGAIHHHVLRNGKVVCDRNWKQQVVGGMWVHWIQKGMDPDAWGAFFFKEKRCLLRRKEIVTSDTQLVRKGH